MEVHGLGENAFVPPDPDRVRDVVERLRRAELIPPVTSVELIAGGWICVTAAGPLSPEIRSRIADALGPTRWTLRDIDR